MLNMPHEYPCGAIQSESSLLFGLLGQTLYAVLGLGTRSYIHEMQNVRNLHTIYNESRVIEYDYQSDYSGAIRATELHLSDFNIGAHYNDHYIFHTREDADAYLSWAKKTTRDPKPGPSFEIILNNSKQTSSIVKKEI